MVVLSSGLALYLGSTPREDWKFSTLKAAAVTTEMALVMQILVTAIYWPVLHQHMLQMTAHLNDPILHFVLVHIHWFPLFGIGLCVALSRN